jgi:integrase
MKPASGFQSVWYRSMQKALKLTSLQESFTEHDLRAKVSSDIDSDIDAQKLLQHANVATTRKHYRRKGSITAGAQGFSVIPTNK